MIERCSTIKQPGWLALREALWPASKRQEHIMEMQSFLAEPDRFRQFVAYGEDHVPLGFVEASVRSDCVNGTSTSPVVFLEGLYVEPSVRRQGWARLLVGEIVTWARQLGIQELASDTELENELSQVAHKALGFEEAERVVYFRMAVERDSAQPFAQKDRHR